MKPNAHSRTVRKHRGLSSRNMAEITHLRIEQIASLQSASLLPPFALLWPRVATALAAKPHHAGIFKGWLLMAAEPAKQLPKTVPRSQRHSLRSRALTVTVIDMPCGHNHR